MVRIRYENRVMTITFITIACIFILASSFMFISPIYRWTFYAWPCLDASSQPPSSSSSPQSFSVRCVCGIS
ncbi:hypothetical protein GGU10DRAFT_370223, partial [Lentinula aff. detonsa]